MINYLPSGILLVLAWLGYKSSPFYENLFHRTENCRQRISDIFDAGRESTFTAFRAATSIPELPDFSWCYIHNELGKYIPKDLSNIPKYHKNILNYHKNIPNHHKNIPNYHKTCQTGKIHTK
jgi:hypothetical protein